MTLTKYSGQYQELFTGCTGLFDFRNSNMNNLITGTAGTNNNSGFVVDQFGLAASAIRQDVNTEYFNTGIVPAYTSGTILAWINLDGNPYSSNDTGYCGFFLGGINTSTVGFSFLYDTPGSGGVNTHRIRYYMFNSSGAADIIVESASTIQGIWYMIGLGWNNTAQKSYKIVDDSVYSESSTWRDISGSTHAIHIGGNVQSEQPTYRPQRLTTTQVMSFNRLLSAAEVKAIYRLTSKKYLYPVLPGIRGVE